MGFGQIPTQRRWQCGDLNQVAYPFVINCTVELLCPVSGLPGSEELSDFAKLKSYNRLRHLLLA
jgi:hypothetical protein